MSLVFSAITPHPPIILPKIGKGEEKKANKTIQALYELSERLRSANPEIIIILTPHTGLYDESFTINANDVLKTDFSHFGDLETNDIWSGSPEFAANIVHAANHKNIRVQLSSDEIISHGISIPLKFLLDSAKNIKILPIGFSNLDINSHIEFGILLKNEILSSTKRIALIISGDLAHTLTEESPSGFHQDGKLFDEKIIEELQGKNMRAIIEIDPIIVEHADQCIYRSLIIACGVLENMQWSFDMLSYEYPFGVGYLTGEFLF